MFRVGLPAVALASLVISASAVPHRDARANEYAPAPRRPSASRAGAAATQSPLTFWLGLSHRLKSVLQPLRMSDVKLEGEYKEAERRNQEVLLSLNHTEWACHFTSTANLTKCATSGGLRWVTLVKNLTDPKEFTRGFGFIAAGNDVKPAANVSVAACKAACTASSACKAVSFEESVDDENKTDTMVKCYWKKTAAFTPQKSNCVAPGGADKPVCSPLPGEMGLGGYYGHYQGHWMSATAFLYNTSGNTTVKEAADRNIARLAEVMEAWKGKYSIDGYLFPYDPIVWDKLLAGHGAGPYYSVPFYTLHKLMAGLLDQYHFAGNTQAYEMVQKMAQWVHDRVEAVLADPEGGMELWQKVLLTEWGGMNDVLFNLYEHTGNEMHLKTARRFNGYVFTARLAAGEDDLSLLPFPHANFHLPEVVGMARAYEITGNTTDKKIVDTFFEALYNNHSYATAGSNSGECWQAPRDLGNFLDTQTEESCTQYNVLKVARRSFLTSAEASKADFYERAILNGILGNQNKEDPIGATSYIYMQPLGGVNTKPWGKSDYGFPCCWGTLSESFAKLGDSIFFWKPAGSDTDTNAAGSSASSPAALLINQFVSATATLRHLPGNVAVKMVAGFPVDPTTTADLTIQGSGTFDILVRVPEWAKSSTNLVTVNGVAVHGAPYTPQSYLRVSGRSWKNGDRIEIRFPMNLWTAPLNDYHPEHNATLAFMYGPLVLAGVNMSSDIWVPEGGSERAKTNPAAFIRRSSNDSLTFEGTGADGSSITMIPLKDVMSEEYVVYFMTAGTKPPQPHNGYCPHSRGDATSYDFEEPPADVDPEVTAADPPGPPPPPLATQREHPTIHSVSKGASWKVVNGRLEGHVL